MLCPNPDCRQRTLVTDIRPTKTGLVKRRRKCDACGRRFSTLETYLAPLINTRTRLPNTRIGRAK